MQDRSNRAVSSLLLRCLACLVVASVVNADGRVFVLNLRNSTGLPGFRDAERACASLHARLASSAELHHAVAECFFSPCTRGWLYGGSVGTTVCNVAGSTLKAVDVKTENATEDVAHLDAFCIKDKGEPCGDPPSFPNARLQRHSGYEMGDELLYTCVPGYAMPSGHRAFSLLCDSCGEWYGLVEMCVKADHTESHIDYEDKFPDSYGEADHRNERAEEALGKVHQMVHGAAYPEGKTGQERQETVFGVEEKGEVGGKVAGSRFGEEEAGEERAVEDFTGHPVWEEDRRVEVKADVPSATDAPISLLSQKHLFWFPSEAFQGEGHPASTHPVSQTTQRASGVQSEESKENESQEIYHHQSPVNADDHEAPGYDDPDREDYDDQDDDHHNDQDDRDSHQEEDDHQVKHHITVHRDDLDRRGHHDDDHHDEHYDMGEHEEERGRTRYGSQEVDDQDDAYDEHESYEDQRDITDDHEDDDQEHPDGSRENPDQDDQDDHDDHDDGQEHYDHDDHEDSREHHDHDGDNDDHFDGHDDLDDPEHDDHDSYEHHDSHEDIDGRQHHVIFSVARDEHQNISQATEGGKASTDESWLDGYPVNAAESENGDTATERTGLEGRGMETATGLPASPTKEPRLDQEEEMWAGFIPTDDSSQEHSQPSDSDTQAAPTQSWLDALTEHPLVDHNPAPPVHDRGSQVVEHTVHNLPGESGQREGEIGEAICTGKGCPPATPSSKGPKVATIIVVVCLIVIAVLLGVWCYRRQQQKSSVYEMNGKGQSQARPNQQMEMQQKV